jgi:hypothetical protein
VMIHRAMQITAPSKTGMVSSNPAREMDACLLFLMCFCCPVEVGTLRRTDPPSKESYRLCIGSKS